MNTTVAMPYAALCCMNGEVDAELAPSFQEALELLRERAENWEQDPDHPVEVETATLDQLSDLYAFGHEDERENYWVQIADVICPTETLFQGTTPLEDILNDLYTRSMDDLDRKQKEIRRIYKRRIHPILESIAGSTGLAPDYLVSLAVRSTWDVKDIEWYDFLEMFCSFCVIKRNDEQEGKHQSITKERLDYLMSLYNMAVHSYSTAFTEGTIIEIGAKLQRAGYDLERNANYNPDEGDEYIAVPLKKEEVK